MDMVTRFLSFDKLMGASLVKIVYYLGLLGIAIAAVSGLFGALGEMGSNFLAGLGALIVVPIAAVVGVCFVRFACELYIVLFRMGEDLTAIRAARPAALTASPPPAA